MPETLTLEFEVLTPLFLGDADQSRSLLRLPSIKGLLRGWYRAISPDFARADRELCEARLFGSATTGQCPFLLRVREMERRTWRWERQQIDRFNSGYGKDTRNGLRYLGYPFDLLERTSAGRTAIGPGSRFEISMIFPRAPTPAQRRAVLVSAWLLGHLGGAGSRSRRGFGSLALRGWESPWDEQGAMPLLHSAADTRAWRQGLDQGLATARDWLGRFPSGSARPIHPHIADPVLVLIDRKAERDWAMVLDPLGRGLQDFRLRRPPDYQQIKDHLTGKGRLQRAPERAAFGLPLTFRYSSVRARPITFVPFDNDDRSTLERHGSLLHLRVVALADGLHPLYLRLAGNEPGTSGTPVAPRGEGRPLRAAHENAVDACIADLRAKLGRD